MVRLRAALLGLSAFIVLSLGVAVGPGPAAARELTIGITQYPTTFQPSVDPSVAKSYILGMTRRPLTVFDQDWELICMLCVELPTFENGLAVREPLPEGVDSPTDEGVALTYRIRPEATWGDGTPVTSDDAVFTWQVGRHPQSGVGSQELFRRILSVEPIDEKTFVLHVDRISFQYNAVNDFNLLPAHIERPIFEAGPAEYRNRTAYDADPTNPGLAHGPYRIVEVVTGSRVVLEPNETWWGPPPAFERITVRVIENTAALEANLLSGSIDMIAGELGLTLDQALAFEKRHGEDYQVVYQPGLLYEHIDLNLDNPILQDRRLRHALIHAIDRAAISERLFAGRQPVAHSSVSPLDWVYWPGVPKYDYDPDRAEALLAAAGWSELRRGVRHDAEGNPLSLEIMTTAGARVRELVQQVLQSQWREVGIDLRIRNEPARVFFGETVSKRRFSAMAMFAWASSPENVPRSTLHSEEIPTAENGWSGQNYTGFRNAEMDALIEAIEVELDPERRKEMWARLQEIYAVELPVIPLYWRANPYILPRWLAGVRPTGQMASTTLWIEEWRVQ